MEAEFLVIVDSPCENLSDSLKFSARLNCPR